METFSFEICNFLTCFTCICVIPLEVPSLGNTTSPLLEELLEFVWITILKDANLRKSKEIFPKDTKWKVKESEKKLSWKVREKHPGKLRSPLSYPPKPKPYKHQSLFWDINIIFYCFSFCVLLKIKTFTKMFFLLRTFSWAKKWL